MPLFGGAFLFFALQSPLGGVIIVKTLQVLFYQMVVW